MDQDRFQRLCCFHGRVEPLRLRDNDSCGRGFDSDNKHFLRDWTTRRMDEKQRADDHADTISSRNRNGYGRYARFGFRQVGAQRRRIGPPANVHDANPPAVHRPVCCNGGRLPAVFNSISDIQ